MKLSAIKKFKDALAAAGIEVWQAVTDVGPGNYYNNDVAINVLDEAEETLFNIRKSTHIDPFGGQGLIVQAADLGDVHEVRFAGSLEEVKKFIDAYGLNVTDEDHKILVNINGANLELKPMVGDYLKFVRKTDEEVAAMDEKHRAEYEAQLKAWEAVEAEKKKMTRPTEVLV